MIPGGIDECQDLDNPRHVFCIDGRERPFRAVRGPPGRLESEKRPMTKAASGDSKSTLYCSFCGKSQHEVRKLIAGPTVFICDECVELCKDIIQEAR